MQIQAIDRWFNLVAVALLGGLALYTWHFRKERGALAQTATMAAKALCILSLVLIDTVRPFEAKVFWSGVQDAMLQAVPVLAFLLYRDLSREYVQVPRWVPAIMVLSYLLSQIAAWTNPWHHLYAREITLIAGQLTTRNGPLSHLAMLGSYLTMATGLGVIVLWVRRARGLRRRHAVYFGTLLVGGWLGHALGWWSVVPGLAPLPVAWLLTGLMSAWAYQRWRIHTVVPLAWQTALRTTANGLLVVDDTDHVVDLNGPAREILAGLEVREGTCFATLCRAWPDLIPRPPESTRDVSRTVKGRLRTYRLRETPLFTGRHILGKVLVFQDITQEKEQQARLMSQERALAILTERDRLGRELHDGPAQVWSFISMQVETALSLLDSGQVDPAREKLQRLREVTQALQIDLRESIAGLHPLTATPGDLLTTLEAQMQWYRHHGGLQATLSVEGPWDGERLAPEVCLQVQRILLEALANVRKSAKASRVELLVQQQDTHTTFKVTDDGCGFDPGVAFGRTGHHGLTIMADRASEIGAELNLESQPGQGTALTLRLPVLQPMA